MRELSAELACSDGQRLMAGTRRVENAGLADEHLTEPAPMPEPEFTWTHCDADQACDRAKYEVFIAGSDLFKGCRTLYFCGHHFRENEKVFNDRKYGIRKI